MTINATLNPVVESIRLNGKSILRGGALVEARMARIADAIGEVTTPTWSEYSQWLAEWNSIDYGTDTAKRKAWSRLMSASGVTIPKSDSPEAKAKQKAREEAKAKIDAMDDEALKKRALALKELGETKSAGKYEKALQAREEARKPETIVKNTLKAFQKALKALEENPGAVTMAQIENAYRALGITLG